MLDKQNIVIVPADQQGVEDVKNITQATIRSIYPHYYPSGAVKFFSDHHSDEHIAIDIADGKVYLLKNNSQYVGTVTISGNNINRLFVLPEYQHRGYGKALLDFAETEISKQYDSSVVDASFPAKSIYMKRGYVEIEYNIIDTDNGDYLCYDVMIKKLLQ